MKLSNTIIIIAVLSSAIVVGCGDSTSRAGARQPLAAETTATAEPLAVSPVRPGAELVESAPVAPVETVAAAPVAEEQPAVEIEVEASPSASPELELLELVMAHGVERHHPVGAASSFSAANPPYVAYMQIANNSENEQQVVIRYQHESGREVGPARLTIPAHSPGWRTFSRTAWVTHPGGWTVTVSTRDGQLLAQREFSIES